MNVSSSPSFLINYYSWVTTRIKARTNPVCKAHAEGRLHLPNGAANDDIPVSSRK